MNTADDERAARLQRYADDHRERQMQLRRERAERNQRDAERQHAEHATRLVPEPRQQADHPEDQAARPATGDQPASATPRRTDRQPVTAACCPDCHVQLPRAPRIGADARCEQCRRPRRRKTHRQQYDDLVGA